MDLNELGQDFANTFAGKLHEISNQLDKIRNIYQQGIQSELQNINANLRTLSSDVQAVIRNRQ